MSYYSTHVRIASPYSNNSQFREKLSTQCQSCVIRERSGFKFTTEVESAFCISLPRILFSIFWVPVDVDWCGGSEMYYYQLLTNGLQSIYYTKRKSYV